VQTSQRTACGREQPERTRGVRERHAQHTFPRVCVRDQHGRPAVEVGSDVPPDLCQKLTRIDVDPLASRTRPSRSSRRFVLAQYPAQHADFEPRDASRLDGSRRELLVADVNASASSAHRRSAWWRQDLHRSDFGVTEAESSRRRGGSNCRGAQSRSRPLRSSSSGARQQLSPRA